MKIKYLLALLPFMLFACKEKPFAVVNIYYTSGAGGMYWARPEPAYGNAEAGGYAVLKNFYNAEPGKKILLDGGDWFSQTPEGSLYKAKFPLEIMRLAGYSATGLSYSDLAPGWAELSESLKDSPLRVISSNLKTRTNSLPPGIKNYAVEETGGVKLGLFSLVIKNNTPGVDARLGGMEIRDDVKSAAQAVDDLKNAGADIIILLVDIGENSANYDERAIVEQVEGIDLLLGSAAPGEKPSMEKYGQTHIVKTVPFLAEASKIKLTFDKDKNLSGINFNSVPLLKERYGEDEEIKNRVAQLRQNTHKKLNAVIAAAQTDIPDIDDGPAYLGELAAGCLKEWAKTDIAVFNSDSIRADITAGKITDYSLYEVYPYNDTVMSVRVRGEELKNILEKSLSSKNNFPQVAGMKIEYDPAAPEGRRVKKILINGGPVFPQAIYRMAATDHIIAGGFGHDEYVNSVEFKNTGVEVRTVLRLCLQKKKIISNAEPAGWKKINS